MKPNYVSLLSFEVHGSTETTPSASSFCNGRIPIRRPDQIFRVVPELSYNRTALLVSTDASPIMFKVAPGSMKVLWETVGALSVFAYRLLNTQVASCLFCYHFFRVFLGLAALPIKIYRVHMPNLAAIPALYILPAAFLLVLALYHLFRLNDEQLALTRLSIKFYLCVKA